LHCKLRLNLIEPPRYGPVCQVVWEGRRREAPPYPDLWHRADDFGAAARTVCCRGFCRPAQQGKPAPDAKRTNCMTLPNMGRPAAWWCRASVRPHHLQHVGTISLELALADAADLR